MEVIPYKVYSNREIVEKRLGKKITPKVSLFYVFYNKIDFLRLVFASIETQTYKDFEVVICDDGSRPEIVQEIHQMMKTSNLFIKHVWHEDKGFRKNEILNKGILAAETDYIIFIDQDCVLHPEFVREHAEHKQKRKILAGRRLEFSPLITNWMTPEKIRKGYIQKNMWKILPLISYRKDNQGLKGLYLKNPLLRKIFNRKHRAVVGCNFSVHKDDLLNINGFDMRYVGVGIGEDSDIEYRLNLDGTETLPFVHAAVQYHLYHPFVPRKNNNHILFEEIQNKKIKYTDHGISWVKQVPIIEF